MEFTSLIQTFGSGAVIVILLSILVTEIKSSLARMDERLYQLTGGRR